MAYAGPRAMQVSDMGERRIQDLDGHKPASSASLTQQEDVPAGHS